MPSGEVHHAIHKVGYVTGVPASLYLMIYDAPAGLGYLAGYHIGRYVDPDWDIMGVSTSEANMIKDFKILGYALFGYASIYGAVFRTMHRSFITHFPYISTAIRLLFLLWWIPVLGIDVGVWWQRFVFGVWLGLSHADAHHTLADYLKSKYFKNSNLFLSKKEKEKGKIKKKQGSLRNTNRRESNERFRNSNKTKAVLFGNRAGTDTGSSRRGDWVRNSKRNPIREDSIW